MKKIGRLTPGLLIAGMLMVSLTVMLSRLPAQAEEPNHAGLVISVEPGQVITYCIPFTETEINGLDLLTRAGLNLNRDTSSGAGDIICRIDQQGCAYPEQPCFCQCLDQNSCFYWTYWHRGDAAWQFSAIGASTYQVQPGSVDGWLWGSGESTLPPLTFAEICGFSIEPTPTATATPEPIKIYLPLIIKD